MSTSADLIVIASAVRTPLGKFQGELSGVAAHVLGAHAVLVTLRDVDHAPRQPHCKDGRRTAQNQAEQPDHDGAAKLDHF